MEAPGAPGLPWPGNADVAASEQGWEGEEQEGGGAAAEKAQGDCARAALSLIPDPGRLASADEDPVREAVLAQVEGQVGHEVGHEGIPHHQDDFPLKGAAPQRLREDPVGLEVAVLEPLKPRSPQEQIGDLPKGVHL